MAGWSICGAPSTPRAKCSTSWSRAVQQAGGAEIDAQAFEEIWLCPRQAGQGRSADLTPPRPMISGSQDAMNAVDGATTGRRIRIGRRGDENARCKGSRARIGAKISLSACRHPEYLLRPTPSHLGKNAPSLSGGGRCRRGVKSSPRRDCCSGFRRCCARFSIT